MLEKEIITSSLSSYNQSTNQTLFDCCLPFTQSCTITLLSSVTDYIK